MNDYVIGVDTRQLDHMTNLLHEWEEALPDRHVTCMVHGMADAPNLGQWMCDEGTTAVLLTVAVDDNGLPVTIIRSAGSWFEQQTRYGDWPAVLGYDPFPLPDMTNPDWLARLIDGAHSRPAASSQ